MSLPGMEYSLNDCIKINSAKVFEVAMDEMKMCIRDRIEPGADKEERISESDRAHRAVGRVDRTDPAALLQRRARQ